MRRVVALAAVVGSLVAWMLGVAAPPATAHALLQSSTPAANATLDAPPSELVLHFTEPPDPGLSSIRLLDASGAEIRLGAPGVSGRTITVPIASEPVNGTYTVDWRVVSRTDGHVTAGSFAFGVGEAPAPTGAVSRPEGASPFPSALSIAAKWSLYVGLALLLAGAVVVFPVLRVERPPRWPAMLGAGAAALGWIGFVAAEASAIGVSAASFLSSESGRPYVWLGATTGAAAASAIVWSVTSRRAAAWVAALLAAAAMLVRSIGGHADTGSLAPLEVVAQFTHVLAVGIWLGGVAWLLLLVRRIEPSARVGAVRRFSTTAGFALAVVAATGVVRALDELGGPTELGRLFDTDYGWTLVAKIAAAAALIAAGAWNRYRNVPRIEGGVGELSLRRTLTAEAVLAAAIFALTGLLTGLPPARSASAQPGPAGPRPLVVTGSDFATTVRARLEISPGVVGMDRFAARIVDYDSGRPVDADRVSLRFSPLSHPELASSTLRLDPAAGGMWAGSGSALSIDDRWRLLLTVETATGSTQVEFEVSPRAPTGRLSVAQGQPTLYTVTFDDGSSIQAYVDPGTSGRNQLHATAFDPSGSELPLASISLIAIPPDGRGLVLDPQRFSAGHYAANVTITPGAWRFEVRARPREGGILDARFGQRFGGTG